MEDIHRRIARYISQADEYYEEGLKLLGEHPNKACESVWGAVDRATRALTLKLSGREEPPEGVSWVDFLQDVFIKAGLRSYEARIMALQHRGVRGELHGRCFYGGCHDKVEHEKIIRESLEYIQKIKEILQH